MKITTELFNQPHPEDAEILHSIKQVIHQRKTYGYRRVTTLINHVRKQQAAPPVNHKRVYRIMRDNQLLLAKHGKKPTRTHDGNIITLNSNMRWCSDYFAINCWNGDRVFVAFSLDTCDREVMRYIASTRGVDGQMIRDMLLETVEYRFNQPRTPHSIQWLTDNGSCYTAHETVRFARELGFDVCTTPAYSPESNGMAEALVKTIKRDYVYVSDCSDADTVMKQLPAWFDDYNNIAPHKGLKMMSPRQFINLKTA